MHWPYTITEARDNLRILKEAERAIIEGQAKSYRIGSREYTAFDLEEIRKRIEYFSEMIAAQSGEARSSRVVRIVPRDL